MKKTWNKPEMLKLGSAATLTLGGEGCTADGMNCKMNDTPSPF